MRKRKKMAERKNGPSVDLRENLSLGGIVISSELAIFHAETIAPEGEMSYRGLLT